MSAAVTLLGRIGSDPEVKFGSSGKAIARFSLVTDRSRQVDGAWVNVDTTWWRVVCFGALAERVADTIHKGKAVIVVGDVKQVEWEQDGQKRTSMEVLARTVGVDLRWDSGGVQRSQASVDEWATPVDPLPQADAAPF